MLVKIPFSKCLEVAEKVKFKMPIELNDLNQENSKINSFWNHFETLNPRAVSGEKKRMYFTAPYSNNLKKKLENYLVYAI